jgi:hypothetical protein
MCKPGFMAGATFGAEFTAWSYLNLAGLQRHKGALGGAVALQAPGQTGLSTNYWGHEGADPWKAPNAIPIAGDWEQVDRGVARLARLIDDAQRPSTQPVEVEQPPISKADEIRKLADLYSQGFLSAEEFDAAKTQLLKNL